MLLAKDVPPKCERSVSHQTRVVNVVFVTFVMSCFLLVLCVLNV